MNIYISVSFINFSFMKRSFLFLSLLLLCLKPGFSEDTIRIYMDKNFEIVDKDKSDILRKVIIDDKKIYHIWDSYMNGKRIVDATYKSINPWIEDGKFSYYSQDGKLSASGFYDNGYMTGQWIYYYDNHTDTVDYTSARALLGDLSFSWLSGLNIETSKINMSDSQEKYVEDHIQFPLRALETHAFSSVTVRVSGRKDGKKDLKVLSFQHPDNAYEACRLLLAAPDSFYYKKGGKAGKISEDFYFEFGVRKMQDPVSADTVLVGSDTTSVFVFVDEQATFQGGTINEFRNWVQFKLVYPPQAVMRGEQGRVTLQFEVNQYGKVANVTLLRSCGSEMLDNEALRAVRSSPLWVPARQSGRIVRQQFVIPVIFNIAK
jgi:TonB family protein